MYMSDVLCLPISDCVVKTQTFSALPDITCGKVELTTCTTVTVPVPGMHLPVAFLLITQVIWVEGHITYIAARLPLEGERAKPGSPWPEPEHMEQTDVVMTLDPASFLFTSNVENCDILSEAFKRYKKLVFFDTKSSKDSTQEVMSLEVKVKDKQCQDYPSFDMDESYQLNVTSSASLSANSVWGALRGLETFSQLIYTEDRKYKVKETHITDRPRFKYRGTMVDTARHYLPIPILLKHMDAMSYNKLNVFHWHIVDDQSFPYVSRTFPQLAQKGAYTSKHVYTQKDVKNIIDYARMRGIRVIPEFDTPGHAQGWGKAFKYLLTACWVNGTRGQALNKVHSDYENLDPTQNATYDFLSEFFSEVKDVFKDEFLHMGMDEAHYMCWESSPNITAFMKQQGYQPGEYYKLVQYFSDRLLDIISGMDRRYVIWQDPIDHGGKVSNDSLVHIWKDEEFNTPTLILFEPWENYMVNITQAGYNVILSACWYLNVIKYGQDWEKYYTCDPFNFTGTDVQKELIKGGEACMWAEYVDGTNFLPRYWPRASAVAERLWSPASVNDTNKARFRLDQQRCRMVRRGVPAEPILPGYCGDYDYGFPVEEPVQPVTTDGPVCTGCSSVTLLNIYLLLLICIHVI